MEDESWKVLALRAGYFDLLPRGLVVSAPNAIELAAIAGWLAQTKTPIPKFEFCACGL